ncbi:phage Gp37/Gp68 family protein [Neorhizobium petrolearium]|uniref:Phage Gp37/Gp68 family protein n=1 Tax=Neorhizobium petrolearium TaxID=515361 RepID=A0ABY8M4K1_9HYPH|nr:phage Gp37/Gp68 family protein [Neorhizobium petrolearium]MCC2608357.1 phage Gp37/Gp68 family protein [Neorhizobium petrolearium]WGI68636.1 phage Gp37/Gp68 family protein [Neorhizobium petrolearium]
MAENSPISWTRHTWNPWMGCTKVSPACDGCYAEALMDKRYGKVKWGPHAERVLTSPGYWKLPYRWQRQAECDGDRPFVFCASLADIFDNQINTHWRADAFEVMRRTPNLVYLLLTKRPQNIIKLVAEVGYLPTNAAIGATIEDQQRADINLPALDRAFRALPAAFSFVSCEPLLGQIVIPPHLMPHWVITGGETDQGGHKARPTHPDWFRSLRDQCAAAGVPFHHKQNGEWVSVSEVAGPGAHFTFEDGATVRRVGRNLSGRTIDGVTHDAFPEVRHGF